MREAESIVEGLENWSHDGAWFSRALRRMTVPTSGSEAFLAWFIGRSIVHCRLRGNDLEMPSNPWKTGQLPFPNIGRFRYGVAGVAREGQYPIS